VIRWNDDKDKWLQTNRGISFQEIAAHILTSDLIDLIENPARKGQQAFVVHSSGYVWVVPFVLEEDNSIFLKTAYPSRKMNKRYGGKHEGQD
jgi:uncharacterized DUF497 family protein